MIILLSAVDPPGGRDGRGRVLLPSPPGPARLGALGPSGRHRLLGRWFAWLCCSRYAQPAAQTLHVYVALCAFSCLLITKDELVHQEKCDGFEHWLHSLLFVLHPLVLLLGQLWWTHQQPTVLGAQLALLIAFGAYQLIYWSSSLQKAGQKPAKAGETQINNQIYDSLKDRWHGASDDPIALLRAESRLRNPWILGAIRGLPGSQMRVPDVAGAPLERLPGKCGPRRHRSRPLRGEPRSGARHGCEGKDQLRQSGRASSRSNRDLDAVCAMDVLEHVEDPAQAIAEAARVLKPGGLFFFHTFNRTPLSWFIVIKGVEWVVKNTPKDLHLLRLFIKPKELKGYCAGAGLQTREIRGVRPKVFSRAFLGLLSTGEVDLRSNSSSAVPCRPATPASPASRSICFDFLRGALY